MKIILAQDIDKLGKAGEIVAVKDGYARNFILPKGLAKEYTPANMKEVEVVRQREVRQAAQLKTKAEKRAEELSRLSLTLRTAVGEEEKFYGSITAGDIEEALTAEGFEIDRHSIVLDGTIKELGVYHIPVKLHPEVTAEVKVWVVKQ